MALDRLVKVAMWLGSQLIAAPVVTASSPIVSGPGHTAVIPSWDLQSSTKTSSDVLDMSKPGFDTSSWYHADTSRCTIVGCLIEAGLYTDTEIWFSNNLKTIDWDKYQFQQPWFYRQEFTLSPATGQHYFLQTNGIGSKADIYVNGMQITDKILQSGSYGGHTYDITSLAAGINAVLIRTYPTNYKHDFSTGFVDWNPYPPDNSSGVWREVTVKQTGPVVIGPLYITTDWSGAVATIRLKTTATNLESSPIDVSVDGLVAEEKGGAPIEGKQAISFSPGQSREISLPITVHNPRIWWPKQWGDQPMYAATLSVSVDGAVSDSTTHSFGIRKVSKILNLHNDTQFFVNDLPFQVLGSGYTSDMFLRWSSEHFTHMVQYTLDMGLNTIRIEGKMDQPELYDIADRLGLMVLPGWECCGKWEAWSYNDVLFVDPVPVWDANDFATANASMRHEASWLQTHPSVLGFLVGSDFWPTDEATAMYVDALQAASWQTPILASASKRSYPAELGPSGLKMDGPYDWVPPNYWWDRDPTEARYGSSFGFGSELGSGVGTPELGSLKKFLTQADLDDLWQQPHKKTYHVSTSVIWSLDRTAYNDALRARYGAPESLEDYLLKAQIMDYEATRSQYEGYSAFWNADRPATGLVYWMLNNAWPSLHWNQFDSYLHPAGSYYGTKTGGRLEHAAYDYVNNAVYLINHSRGKSGARVVKVDVIDLHGNPVSNAKFTTTTAPNTSKKIASVSPGGAKTVVFLRLVLLDEGGMVLSRNVYWVAPTIDNLVWANSTWSLTPVSNYADFSSLRTLSTAEVSVSVRARSYTATGIKSLSLENKSTVPAFFIRLNLVDKSGADVVPVYWSDNYVTLYPGEKLTVRFRGSDAAAVDVSGWNVDAQTVAVS